MPGGITYEPSPVPLARPSARLAVYRYSTDAVDPQPRYELMPNVRCLGVQFREGADPGVARFRYTFVDPELSPDDPRRVEDVYGFEPSGPRVIRTDDRLVVRAFRGDGYSEILFDGFVQAPQADLDAETESVTLLALGTPFREWDEPLAGAVMRDAAAPATVSDVWTSLPARFNPNGDPNASPKDADSGTAAAPYPVFLGPVTPENEVNGKAVRPWTLGMAARYVVATGNQSRPWVDYDDLTYLDDVLQAPKTPDAGAIDEDTASFEPIEVQDVDVTGMAWPEALERLIDPHGFAFRFILESDDIPEDADPGTLPDPRWTFRVYRKSNVTPMKTLMLQAAGSDLDPARTNVGALSLSLDTREIVNAVSVDAAPVRVEASFVLAPLFEPAIGDTGLYDHFVEGDAPLSGDNRDKYRLFGFDECGEGHWDFATNSWLTGTPGDMAKALTLGATKRPFVQRRRPGIGTLINVDDKGEPLKWQLDVSYDYTGPEPGVWNGKGTWQKVKSGELDLLDDRLGVRITCKDPNSWSIGDGTVVARKALCLVDQIANPGAVSGPRPRFRLTCCVDTDRDFQVSSGRRMASPTVFVRTRRVDARDRFKKHVVSRWSALNQAGVGITEDVVTDDTAEAQAHSDGVRRSRETGVFAGSVTIPRLSTAYQIGDRVDRVDGRGISLRMNAAAEAGESPVYPVVVALSYELDGQQTTTLSLSDRRAEPPPERRRRDRP